jgi:hypothetical protein
MDYNGVRATQRIGLRNSERIRTSEQRFLRRQILSNTGAKPGQGDPYGLASFGLDPAPTPV